jgi:hypothetical protein
MHATADARTAYADHLFQEGLKLMKGDDCPQAILKFQASEQLDASAATLINLATCYARLGRAASAWRSFRRAAAQSIEEGNEEFKEKSFDAIAKLAPTLTKLKVVPPRGSARMTLTLNGEPIADNDGLPLALDPGENIIEASVPGQPSWHHTVNATELGATIVIEVPEATPEADHESSRWSAWRTGSVATAGLGFAGIVAGLILGLSARATHDEALRTCSAGRCDVSGHDLWLEANRKADVATYLVGIGTIVTLGGIGLWIATPSAPKQTAPSEPRLSSQSPMGPVR